MKLSTKAEDRIVDIAKYTFIVLFLYTGLSKIVDSEVFVISLGASPIGKINPILIAWAVPIVEIITVVLLLIPKTQRIGLVLSLILMVIFTAYVAIILSINKKLPCSCGGIFYKITWKPHLILNITLTIMAGLSVWIIDHRQRSFSPIKNS